MIPITTTLSTPRLHGMENEMQVAAYSMPMIIKSRELLLSTAIGTIAMRSQHSIQLRSGPTSTSAVMQSSMHTCILHHALPILHAVVMVILVTAALLQVEHGFHVVMLPSRFAMPPAL